MNGWRRCPSPSPWSSVPRSRVPCKLVVVQNVVFWILAVGWCSPRSVSCASQNVVHAALYRVVVLGGAAAQYILLAAEFVAWVQVLIYIGAVIILFLFGIMLTRAPMRGDTDLTMTSGGRPPWSRSSSSECSRRC